MTVLDPATYDVQTLLLMDDLAFPEVLTTPHRQGVEGSDVLTFSFANGYGAVVTRVVGQPMLRAFEFCVLDCTHRAPRPTFRTPVADNFLCGLSRDGVAALLARAEALPRHRPCCTLTSSSESSTFKARESTEVSRQSIFGRDTEAGTRQGQRHPVGPASD